MNVALWIIAIVLGLAFLAAGLMKIAQPRERLVLVMAGATVVHARRKENQMIPVTLILLVLAAAVAVGRFGP